MNEKGPGRRRVGLDLDTLRLFEAAVRCGAISAAAAEQNIAISAVSRRLSDLESRLGTALLYRKVRGVTPTPAGRALLRHACDILRLAEGAAEEMSEFADGSLGQVRVSANPSTIVQFLPAAFASFGALNPGVRFQLREQLSDAVVRDLWDGQADIGLFSGSVPHDGIETFGGLADHLCVVAKAGHPVAALAAASVEDLARHPHVALEDGSSLFREVAAAIRAVDGTLDVHVRVHSFDGVRKMVSAGLGLAVLPEAVVRPYAESDDVVAVPLDAPWAKRQFLIGVRERAALSGAGTRFLDHLRAMAAEGTTVR